ncbi:MAG: hypothetical protein RIB57_10995 [Pelagibacterium sp.]|uniref:hypothetical protein n=1 Tax=Pelagibacterium sp. TaxID=1967288 RepID=UPI0032EF4218
MDKDPTQARNWPSLAHQMALAEHHFGPSGEAMIACWLQEEVRRCSDPDFSRLFFDHIALEGIAQADYNHRLMRSRDGTLLGGIRFYRRNIARPFVEIIAHSFANLASLRAAVASEWRSFSPTHLRLNAPAHRFPAADAQLDISIHFASYRELSKAGLPPISLTPMSDINAAAAVATGVYDQLALENPELAEAIGPADASDLEACHESEGLFAIRATPAGPLAGLLAVRPATIDWIEGDEVVEELILPEWRGKGLAASAQQTLGRRRQRRATVLIGTIDRLNTASRRTALRAGRPERLRKVFLPLERP